MTDFSSYGNPGVIGPGVWYLEHMKCENIESEFDIQSIGRDIELIRKNFSCSSCRVHFNEYCDENDPNIAMEKDIRDLKKGKKPEHLAKWFVEAHNNATKKRYERYTQTSGSRVFKAPVASYEDVSNYFTPISPKGDLKPCEDCDSDTDETEITPYNVIPERSHSIKKGNIRLSPRPSLNDQNSSNKFSNKHSTNKKSQTQKYNIKITAFNNNH